MATVRVRAPAPVALAPVRVVADNVYKRLRCLRCRIPYVFWNPVKHGLVQEPAEYPFCNYNDFLHEEWFDLGEAPVEVENVPEF